MRFIHALFLLALIAGACNKEKNQPYSDKCFFPILLSPDTTSVRIASYTTQWRDITSVKYNNQSVHLDSTGYIKLGPAEEPISILYITGKDFEFELPVFKSEKIKYHFEYNNASPTAKKVELAGSMNGWNRKAMPLQKINGVWQTDLTLNRGQYAYRIWEDETEKLDEGNPVKIDNGLGGENSAFEVGEKLSEAPQLITRKCDDNKIEITAQRASKIYAFWMNRLIDVTQHAENISIAIPAAARSMENSEITVLAHDGTQRSNDLVIPLQRGKVIKDAAQLPRTDMRGAVMYFAMIDRFNDGDESNNFPVQDPTVLPKANNMGGDLQGITAKIKDGYFEKLGINTLWLSPVTDNAEGAWGLWDKGVTSKFSGYHGYWPTSLRSIDRRLGNESAMRELINEAHARGMNVILDYVAHHVHQEHPLYKQHPEWTTPLYLPDGTMNTEKWDEHRLTTWFDTFLPTWKFADHQVVDALTDTAMYWVETFELDGFRHDATKHVEIDFWQTLTQKIEKYRSNHPERKIYQIGETYGNPELISSYIGTGSMDAQFDFNLYDAAVDAFAKKETSFHNLARVMKESMQYYGQHHLMGNITGNQDRARFITYADGSLGFGEDPKLAGWTRNIVNRGDSGYKELQMLEAFLLTTPGVPCLYYGDEIGMPGANDPDNRRMMTFNDWNAAQQNHFDITSQLIRLRRTDMAFQYGETSVLEAPDNALCIQRNYFGEERISIFYKPSQSHQAITLPEGKYEVMLTSEPIEISGQQVRTSGENSGWCILKLTH